MATPLACPACGTTMREIVWGYGTLADVADAGDVVIGGCVIDVDTAGRVAALQCPACGARADQHGVELERPEPPATTVHPFDVAFSSPQPTRREVTMTEHTKPDEPERVPKAADGSLYVDDDFGGVASGGDWRDHVEPYASREDQLPDASPPARDRIDPYASREDAVPDRAPVTRDRVDPYASREDEVPPAGSSARDRIDPYASRENLLPGEAARAWRDRVDPFAPEPGAAPLSEAAPGEAAPGDMARGHVAPGEVAPGDATPDQAAPGEHADTHWLDTSDTTDAEEEGWPSRD